MVDDKPIIDQIHEYETLCANLISEGLKIYDITFAGILIEKLPQSWNSYKSQLRQREKNLTLEELVSHLKIEEEN